MNSENNAKPTAKSKAETKVKPDTKAKAKTSVDSTVKPQQVIDYLRQHPDFFVKRADLLSRLNLHGTPKSAGKTTSLGQRQVALLREQIAGLEEQLQQLTSVASSNEKLLERWHDLTLGLFSADDVGGFFNLLGERLQQDFKADAVSIVLASGQNLDEEIIAIENVREAEVSEEKLLTELINLKAPHCGRLTQAKNSLLFQASDNIASAAIVPLDQRGVLAIGSHDEHRFAPGMGVLFLELLGKTLVWRLQQHVQSLRKRA